MISTIRIWRVRQSGRYRRSRNFFDSLANDSNRTGDSAPDRDAELPQNENEELLENESEELPENEDTEPPKEKKKKTTRNAVGSVANRYSSVHQRVKARR